MSKKPAPPPEPATIGRPPWEPSEKQRGEVQAFAIAGYTQEEIALYLEVDTKTLREHCRDELDFATMKVVAQAANNVVRLANGVPAVFDENKNCIRAEIPMSLGPNAFILKTKGKKLGWSERPGTGGPLAPEDVDWSQYTDAEIELIARAQQLLSSRAAAPAAGAKGTGATTH